jgi:hypothetical protein
MVSLIVSARVRTFDERTARFWSANRMDSASGRLPRLMRGAVEGIVDFTSRRAITRTVNTTGGGLLRRLAGAHDPDAPPMYLMFDSASVLISVHGRWHTLPPTERSWPRSGPPGLRLVHLLRPESIVDAIDIGEDEVRGSPATRYRVTLDVDRIHWPDPDDAAGSRDVSSLVRFVRNKVLPDPTPKGILSAEVWIDRAGRLVRFSHNDLPVGHPKYQRAPWVTADMWDFGVPPPLTDWTTQRVIDPITLQFPDTERDPAPTRQGQAGTATS